MKKATISTPNIFTRWYYIFRWDFVKSFLLKETPGKTWGFWFLWLTLIAFVGGGALCYIGNGYVVRAVEKFFQESSDFTLRLENDQFTIEGVQQPLVIGEEILGESALVLVDTTEGVLYDHDSFDGYESGVIVTREGLLSKERGYKYQEMLFSDLEEEVGMEEGEPLVLHKADLQEGFPIVWTEIQRILIPSLIFMFWFLVVISPLITALWWALVFWILGEFQFKITGFTFGRSYLAVLNFYIPIMILEWALLLGLGISIPYSTTILMGYFFLSNFCCKRRK